MSLFSDVLSSEVSIDFSYQSQHLLVTDVSARHICSMGNWNVFVTGSCFPLFPNGVICKGELSLTNRFVLETLTCVLCVGH